VGCRDIGWLLALYDNGELSAGEKGKVESHLASCQKCREELVELRQVPALLRSLHGEPWWADVSSLARGSLDVACAGSSASREKGIETIGRGQVSWRAIWKPALVSLVVVAAIVGAILAVANPWEGYDVAHAAAEIARNDPQVQAILGEDTIEVVQVEVIGRIAYVDVSSGKVAVKVEVDLQTAKVKVICSEDVTIRPYEPPVNRPVLSNGEKATAIEIAKADPYVQRILNHGFALGEPGNSHPALGADPGRVVWLPLVGDTPSDECRGVIVDLEDGDATVVWGGDLPQWWPYEQSTKSSLSADSPASDNLTPDAKPNCYQLAERATHCALLSEQTACHGFLVDSSPPRINSDCSCYEGQYGHLTILKGGKN